jgi:hypothetical protein
MDYEKAENWLMHHYNTGEYVFYGVLNRRFNGQAEHIGNYLTEKGYVKRDVLCRCPKCGFALYIKSQYIDEHNSELPSEDFCSACDGCFRFEDLNEEPVWIRL